MTGCFNVKTATADWIKWIQETVLKFVIAKMTETKTLNCKMFNALGIEAVTYTIRRASYKFQDTFLKNIQTFWISNGFV